MHDHDKKTTTYFDEQLPEYSTSRLTFTAEFINRQCGDDLSLVDIGCGTGNLLEFLQRTTKVKNLCGIDVSENYLKQVRERLHCRTVQGSILDPCLTDLVENKFDFALLAAVLHHLIGRTRRESRRLAALAVVNALQLLKTGGHLIVVEPVFYPSIIIDAVFYLKKLSTTVTSSRIQILGKWNNIGAPVVSYFSNEQLLQIVQKVGGCDVVEFEVQEKSLNRLMRLAFIRRRAETTLVLHKQ